MTVEERNFGSLSNWTAHISIFGHSSFLRCDPSIWTDPLWMCIVQMHNIFPEIWTSVHFGSPILCLCKFGPSKSTVVEGNFGPSKIIVVDHNCGPAKIWLWTVIMNRSKLQLWIVILDKQFLKILLSSKWTTCISIFRPAQRPIGLFKITIVCCNLKRSKNRVVERNGSFNGYGYGPQIWAVKINVETIYPPSILLHHQSYLSWLGNRRVSWPLGITAE